VTDPLPDFVGIGALKAGTTFLDGLLREHPQLSFPRFLKEAEYFTAHYDRGLDWYAGLFEPPDGRLRGEISPQYMADPRAPQRVWDTNPEARILANLRNPVARSVSQYRHWVQETGYPHDFTTFLAEHPNALERSQYHQVLTPWLDRFGRERVELIVFEDLVDEPVRTVRSVLRFLGVDEAFVPPDPDTPVNVTFSPRFPRAYAFAKRAGNRLRFAGGARVVHAAKRVGLDRMFRAGQVQQQESPVTQEERDQLAERLRPDVERLSELIGRDLARDWLRG
jgi:hypothetical protein